MYNKYIIPFLSILLFSCGGGYTPKPAGYVRIKTPEKKYRLHDEQDFYSFEIPEYATIQQRKSAPGWLDVVFPQLNGTIHLSYKPVNDNLGDFIADCRTMAYKHTVKAEGIEESPFIHREQNRFGMVYDLEGDVASAVQFFITDSTTHFIRGSLYFNCTPNQDSLKPLVEFVREDIIHLIGTTEWKYE